MKSPGFNDRFHERVIKKDSHLKDDYWVSGWLNYSWRQGALEGEQEASYDMFTG